MPSIQGSVVHQDLTVKQRLIVAGTHNYITGNFSFSSDWDDTLKVVMFRMGDKEIQRELVDDCIVEESTLNLSAGIWKMSIEGLYIVDSDLKKRITTKEVDIVVRKNTNYTSPEPFPSVPSFGELILAKAVEALNVAESSKHYPVISTETNNWMLWDSDVQSYVDSGHTSRGADGLTPFIGNNGNWWIGDEDTHVPASTSGAFNWSSIKEKPFEILGNSLKVTEDGILSVNTTDKMEQDNTLPITSAGVFTTVGNIEALLKTI